MSALCSSDSLEHFGSDHREGREPGDSLLFHVMSVWLFCYAFLSLKFMTEVFIYFNLYAFPHHVGDINASVNLSLTALQNGRETAQSPFTRGSSPWQESAGLRRSLRGWQLPSSSSHSVWCPGEMTMQHIAMPALCLPALPELTTSELHPALMTKAQWERKTKAHQCGKALKSLGNAEVKLAWFGQSPAARLWKRWELDPTLFLLG